MPRLVVITLLTGLWSSEPCCVGARLEQIKTDGHQFCTILGVDLETIELHHSISFEGALQYVVDTFPARYSS
jgi:hypothetical protein